MTTIYDVAKLASVSIASVSRVLNDSEQVSEQTKNKVLTAMNQLDYHPNTSAQSLVYKRTNSVGIMVPEFHGVFYGSLMGSIEATLKSVNKHAFIASGHNCTLSEKESIEFLTSRNCDAMVLHVEALSDDYLIELSKKSIPFVLINRYIKEISHRCIKLDNEYGGYIATKSLLELGHRNLAYISGPLWKKDANDRFLGHQRALAEYNIEQVESLMFEGDFLQSSGSEAMEIFIKQNLPLTAVVCANDQMATGAMLIAHQHNLAIPNDISFIGFDNTILAQYTYPQLTSIDNNIDHIGNMAAKWILKHVYQASIGEIQNLFKPQLITRDSVKSLLPIA